jgi:hypothetical protein
MALLNIFVDIWLHFSCAEMRVKQSFTRMSPKSTRYTNTAFSIKMFDAITRWYINSASQNIKGGTGSDGSQNSDFKIGIWRCTRGNFYGQVNWDPCPESIYVNIDSASMYGFHNPF